METVIMKLGHYRHYKGMDYQVIGLATHSETLETLVVYRQLYGEYGLWVRPAAMFAETVTIDGKEQPRFAYMGPLGETAPTPRKQG